METYEAILTRRSIREYTGQKVSDELIEKLIKAAMYAPSARNYQPWHFIVITDREILNKIPGVHPYADMLNNAPLAILICGDTHLEKSEGYIAIDCAAATQNLLLAAHSSGLGAVWLGVYPREERMKGLIELFELPDNIVPVSLVSIGYPAEEKIAENRFHTNRIHRNTW